MLFALNIADRLGVPLEFFNTTPKQVYSRIIYDKDIQIRFNAFAVTTLKAGSPSDDTESTISLLKVLLSENLNSYNKSKSIIATLKWANQCQMLGKNTKNLFKGLTVTEGKEERAIASYEKRMEKYSTEQKSNMQSNGSLMRTSPLSLLPTLDLEAIKTDVYLSNPNLVNYYCSVCLIRLLRILHTGGSKEDCKKDCVNLIDSHVTADIPGSVQQAVIDSLDANVNRDITRQTKSKGWVCSALYIALKAFWNYDTFESAMEFIIKDHPGSDTDTNSEISATLFGSWLGMKAMQKETSTAKNIQIVKDYDCNSSSDYKLDENLIKQIRNYIEANN